MKEEKIHQLYTSKLAVHKMGMQALMNGVKHALTRRANRHDASKSIGVEKTVFAENIITHPNIWGIVRGEHPLPDTLRAALAIHAKNNDYIPEHFESGASGMTLMQLIEMICDIIMCAHEQSWSEEELIVFLKSDFRERHPSVSDQLISILCNTVPELWKDI